MDELERRVAEVAAWTRTLPEGSRYGIVQALRQTLEAAVRWGLIGTNPAKLAGRNPQPKRDEVAHFEPDEIERLAVELGPVYGPLVIVAAYTGLRPSEWSALEWRDVDRDAGVITIERAFSYGAVKAVKTKGSRRRVPLPLALQRRSNLSRAGSTRGSSSPDRAAPTSTFATGGSGSGSQRWKRQGCRGSGGRTTCDTPMRRGRSPRASPRTTSPATWARAYGCWISPTATS